MGVEIKLSYERHCVRVKELVEERELFPFYLSIEIRRICSFTENTLTFAEIFKIFGKDLHHFCVIETHFDNPEFEHCDVFFKRNIDAWSLWDSINYLEDFENVFEVKVCSLNDMLDKELIISFRKFINLIQSFNHKEAANV